MQANVLNNPEEDFDFDAFIDDLEGKIDIPAVPSKTRETFPCEHCHGSGAYQGVRLHQDKSHCFACKGKGFFYTSKYDRMEKRKQVAETKARKLTDAQGILEEQHPGLYLWLRSATWSSFAISLALKIETYGGLSDRQLEAALDMRAKSEARQAERDAARAAKIAAVVPTLHTLANAFLSSSAHLLHPKLRLQTEDGLAVVLSRCGNRSKTPGQINITDGRPFGENVYYGRIGIDGRAFMRDKVPASVMATLNHFNNDPQAEIKVQGLRTGNCCCCGRTLTDPVSVASGIGPICANKWGF